MVKNFSAYELVIASEIELMLPSSQGSLVPDVTIRLDTVQELTNKRTFDGVWYEHLAKNRLLLKWDHIGSFLIQNGKEITIDPDQPGADATTTLPLLGTVMAVALQQRGCLVLHGSAILINGKVALLLGHKGQGKSTLAASLSMQGFPLLSDDICALDFKEDSELSVRPAFPTIKLNPDIVRHMGYDSNQLQRLHPNSQKFVKNLGDSFCSSSQPLGAICILETGDELKLEQLHGMEAVKEIITHMLINRFPENQPNELRETIFAQSAKTAQSIPVYRLTRPRDLQLLPETIRLLQGVAMNPEMAPVA
jgi:adenylate kinase family enzyme